MPGRRYPRVPLDVAQTEHTRGLFRGGLDGAASVPYPVYEKKTENVNSAEPSVLFAQDYFTATNGQRSFPLTYRPAAYSEKVFVNGEYCREGETAVWQGTDDDNGAYVVFNTGVGQGSKVSVEYAYYPQTPRPGVQVSLGVFDITASIWGTFGGAGAEHTSATPFVVALADDRVVIGHHMCVYTYQSSPTPYDFWVTGRLQFYLFDVNDGVFTLLSTASVVPPWNPASTSRQKYIWGTEYQESKAAKISDTSLVCTTAWYGYVSDHDIANPIVTSTDYLDVTVPSGDDRFRFPGMDMVTRVSMGSDRSTLSVDWSKTVGYFDASVGGGPLGSRLAQDFRYGGSWDVFGDEWVGTIFGGPNDSYDGLHIEFLKFSLSDGAFSRTLLPLTGYAVNQSGERSFALTDAGKFVWVGDDGVLTTGLQYVFDVATASLDTVHTLSSTEWSNYWDDTYNGNFIGDGGIRVVGSTAYAIHRFHTNGRSRWILFTWNGSKLAPSGYQDINTDGGAGTYTGNYGSLPLPEATWTNWVEEGSYYSDDNWANRYILWHEQSQTIGYVVGPDNGSALWRNSTYSSTDASPVIIWTPAGSDSFYTHAQTDKQPDTFWPVFGIGYDPWFFKGDVTPSGNSAVIAFHGYSELTAPDNPFSDRFYYRLWLAVYPIEGLA